MNNIHLFFVFSAPPADYTLRLLVRKVIAHAAKNPDEGSDFAMATRDIRDLPDNDFLLELDQRGYECIVALRDGKFAGFVGFQKHIDETWHSFAYHVSPEHQGNGVGKALAKAFLNAGYKAGIRYMRFYGGNVRMKLSDKNAETMAHLYHDVVLGNKLGLQFICEAGHDIGWIKMRDRVALSV